MTKANNTKTAASAQAPAIGAIERPASAGVNEPGFGSDVIADALHATDIPYIALNPGASYRGLHDSIVNYLGNNKPQMLLCLHEETAVAIAHGWAKVTGKAMAVALHSNVGLMHGTMAVFNAWCDRMPMLVIGATGPLDASRRRPWIDWIHTSADQGALLRGYTKWDDQPGSASAARESILRANWIANTAPCGPTYVNLDAEVQEAELKEPVAPIEPQRYMPPVKTAAPADLIAKAAELLRNAKKPVILAGRGSRSMEAWNNRIALAERLNAGVITDQKVAAGFPTDHPLHLCAPGNIAPLAEGLEALRNADVVLSLDWLDLAGTFKHAGGPPKGKVIQVSVDHQLHNGWSMDYQALPPVDIMLACEPEPAVAALLEALGPGMPTAAPPVTASKDFPAPKGEKITVEHLADHLRRAVGDRRTSLTHTSLSWNGASWHFRHPLGFLGCDGGGGLGGGPGQSVGAALALKGTGRMPIAVCGDGDFLMGITALWTAVHYRIPILFVVANNRSFFNDEIHQERVARMRNRPVENRWIGQRISEPDIDLASMARAQGAVGFGPVSSIADLTPTFEAAIAAVEAGQVAVVDVRVEPGYTPSMTQALTRKSD